MERLAEGLKRTVPQLADLDARGIFLEVVKGAVPLGREQTLDDIGHSGWGRRPLSVRSAVSRSRCGLPGWPFQRPLRRARGAAPRSGAHRRANSDASPVAIPEHFGYLVLGDTVESTAGKSWLELAFGEPVPITGTCSIGRARGNQLVLPDENVSRHHALIRTLDNDESWIVDLASANGTYVNQRRIEHSTRLRDATRHDRPHPHRLSSSDSANARS